MAPKARRGLLVTVLSGLAVLASFIGCSAYEEPAAPPSTSITGIAMAGPISGQVCAYALDSAGIFGVTALACDNTDSITGEYSLQLGNHAGNVLLTAVGTYLDEATGKTISVNASTPLRSVQTVQQAGQKLQAPITPYTEAAVRAAEKSGGLTTANFQRAFLNLEQAVTGKTTTDPNNALIQTLPAYDQYSVGNRDHAYMLAVLSQARLTFCGTDPNCGLNSHLDHISGLLLTPEGITALNQEIQVATLAWNSAHPSDYLCQYTNNTLGCAVRLLHHLVRVAHAQGAVFDTSTVFNIVKPATMAEFCDPTLNGNIDFSDLKPDGVQQIYSCAFDGMYGTLDSVVTNPSGSTNYAAEYTYFPVGSHGLNVSVSSAGIPGMALQVPNVAPPTTQDQFCSESLGFVRTHYRAPWNANYTVTWSLNSCTFTTTTSGGTGLASVRRSQVDPNTGAVSSVDYTASYGYAKNP